MGLTGLILAAALMVVKVQAQPKANGYLSWEFLKGQAQSPYERGSFQNVSAGLLLSGRAGGRWQYSLEARFRETAAPELEQAWVGFVPSEVFQCKAGLFLVPFGRYNRANRPHETLLVNIPLHLQEIIPWSWRELGLIIEGKSGFLSYSVWLGNGLREGPDLRGGQQFQDNNSDKGKGSRLGLRLSRNLELGGSYYRGRYDDSGERDLILQGVDATWLIAGLTVLAEYAKAEAQNPAPFTNGKAEGYFVQASFNLGNLIPVVGYQRLKYEDAFHGLGFIPPVYRGMGISSEGSRWAVGLAYAVLPEILLKIEYDLNRESGLKLRNNLLSLQMSLHF